LVRMLFATVANGSCNNRIHLMLIGQLPTLRAALILLESTPINRRRQLEGKGPAASAGPAIPFST
jgi:hypothetical protein